MGPSAGSCVLIFSGIGVAGVQVSQPLRDAIFPVRRREGGIDTGMALHNREEEAAVVSCRLMKNGAVLEEVEITLAANGQVARFIGKVFTGTDTSDFVGLVRCTAEGVAQFTGMALELDAGNRIFTTLPVVKVNRGRAGEAALDFAHFANGASIVSEMVFMNLETQPSGPPLTPFHQAIPPTRPVIYFYDQEGNPIDPALLVDLTGDLEITEDGALSIQSEMEVVQVSGSVRVVSDGPIGGVLRFDLPGIGVAGVGASQPVRDAIFPARRQAGGISTGAAIHNLGEEALVVGCQLMKDGAVLEEEEISLEAQRTGGPVHRGDVYQYRYIGLRGVGALYGTARGGDVHRSGRGARCGQPHLHHATGGAGSREDVSGIDKGSDEVVQGLSPSREGGVIRRDEGGAFCFPDFTLKNGCNPSLFVGVLFLGFQSNDLFTRVAVPTTCMCVRFMRRSGLVCVRFMRNWA